MAAYALLAVTAAQAKAAHRASVLSARDEQPAPADCGMTALTVPEIQRLVATLLFRQDHGNTDTDAHLAWSAWRRRDQARARWYRYRTRLALIA